jgi:hypothetical protein
LFDAIGIVIPDGSLALTAALQRSKFVEPLLTRRISGGALELRTAKFFHSGDGIDTYPGFGLLILKFPALKARPMTLFCSPICATTRLSRL